MSTMYVRSVFSLIFILKLNLNLHSHHRRKVCAKIRPAFLKNILFPKEQGETLHLNKPESPYNGFSLIQPIYSGEEDEQFTDRRQTISDHKSSRAFSSCERKINFNYNFDVKKMDGVFFFCCLLFHAQLDNILNIHHLYIFCQVGKIYLIPFL